LFKGTTVTVRVRLCVPGPQLAEHWLHVDQSETWQGVPLISQKVPAQPVGQVQETADGAQVPPLSHARGEEAEHPSQSLHLSPV